MAVGLRDQGRRVAQPSGDRSWFARLDEAPFGIGDIAVGCALGYLDFRFTSLDWRAKRPALAAWQTRFKARPSAIATEVRDA